MIAAIPRMILAVYTPERKAGWDVDLRIARTMKNVEVRPIVTTMKIGIMKAHLRGDDMLIQQRDGVDCVVFKSD